MLLLLPLACATPTPTESALEPVVEPEPVAAPELAVDEPEPDGPPEPPPFQFRVTPVDSNTANDMLGSSWPMDCPTPTEVLVTVRVSWIDARGYAWDDGEIVVHRDVAEVVVQGFQAAYDARFPFTSIKPIRGFGGKDDLSMEANNTSAFNCRKIKGTDIWSQHSTGRAIDINPKWNPWVKGDRVDPPSGLQWADRTDDHPGMLHVDSAMTRAFVDAGWGWGGTWTSRKDYQHFSESGR